MPFRGAKFDSVHYTIWGQFGGVCTQVGSTYVWEWPPGSPPCDMLHHITYCLPGKMCGLCFILWSSPHPRRDPGIPEEQHFPGGPLECQGGYQARPKIHVIWIVFQDQAMYARTLFRGPKMCKIGKRCVFGHLDKFWKGHDRQIKKNAFKNTYLGSIFIPEKYVIRALFVSPWTTLIPPLAIQVAPLGTFLYFAWSFDCIVVKSHIMFLEALRDCLNKNIHSILYDIILHNKFYNRAYKSHTFPLYIYVRLYNWIKLQGGLWTYPPRLQNESDSNFLFSTEGKKKTKKKRFSVNSPFLSNVQFSSSILHNFDPVSTQIKLHAFHTTSVQNIGIF